MRYLFVLLLAGCSVAKPDSGETHWTTMHTSDHFPRAMSDAKEHCAAMGMEARHLGSDMISSVNGRVLSRFECVPK